MYVSKAYSLNIANQLYEFDLEDPSKGLRARRAGTIIDEKIKNSKCKKAKKNLKTNTKTSKGAKKSSSEEDDDLQKTLLDEKRTNKYSCDQK